MNKVFILMSVLLLTACEQRVEDPDILIDKIQKCKSIDRIAVLNIQPNTNLMPKVYCVEKAQ